LQLLSGLLPALGNLIHVRPHELDFAALGRETRFMRRTLGVQLEAAQQVADYVIGGRRMARIRYGDEEDDWGADHGRCHDCGAAKGQFHAGPGCDVKRCPSCGRQVISCECEYEGDDKRGFPRGT